MAKIFAVCPVRLATDSSTEQMRSWVSALEAEGHEVHWPERDTNQDEAICAAIYEENVKAIEAADEVHIFWDPMTSGGKFDVGAACALRKPLYLINRQYIVTVAKHKGKHSFEELLLKWPFGYVEREDER